MKIFNLLPPKSARHGYQKTIAQWKDAVFLEFGPEGTMHYSQSNIKGFTKNLYTTGIKEKELVFGDTQNLEKAIIEIDKYLNPEIIFLASSPLSEIIGADLNMVANIIKPKINSEISVWDNIPVESLEIEGIKQGYLNASKKINKLFSNDNNEDKNGVLILGLGESDFNGLSDLNELKRMFKEYFNLECLNDKDGRYYLRDLKRAQYILATNKESEILAKEANRLWGVNYSLGLPYGIKQSEDFLKNLEENLKIKINKQYESDLIEGKILEKNFKQVIYKYKPIRIFLDLNQSINNNVENFISEELELEVYKPESKDSSLYTNGIVNYNIKIEPNDIIIGSGVFSSLYPKNQSICLSNPVINQRTFSRHMPMVGLIGCENFLNILYEKIINRN